MGGKSFLKDLLEGVFRPSTQHSAKSNIDVPISVIDSVRAKGNENAKNAGTTKKNIGTIASSQSIKNTTTKRNVVKKSIVSTEMINHPCLGEVIVLRKSRVRRISIAVKRDGVVRLNIPLGYPMQAGLDFLTLKQEWVTSAIKRQQAISPNRIISPPYNTYSHHLEFCMAEDGAALTTNIIGDKALVFLPANVSYDSEQSQSAIQELLHKVMRQEAKELLPGMVAEIAKRHGFRVGAVTIRATKSRWGSCSATNNISLSLFLMRLPQHLIEYIIVHELCHTVHKNHSVHFHSLVDSCLCGQERVLRAELRCYRPDIN